MDHKQNGSELKMGEKCTLAILSQTELSQRAEDKIIDLVDEAYCNGEDITQPVIEKTLSSPPFNFSHGFVCKKLKQLQQDKKIMVWREKGINHFLITSHGYQSIPQRPNQTVLFPSDLIITNRGGSLFNVKKPLTIPCYVPTEMLIVSFTGDILLCFEDVKRSQVMGNLNTQSLEEIWFSEEFSQARNFLKNGRRAEVSPICKNCNNQNYFAPNMTW